MTDDKSRDLASHPVAQAFGVGANIATVLSFLAGSVVLAWAVVSDKLALGLGVALAISFALNVFLFVRLRKKPKDTAPVWAAAATSTDAEYQHTPEERDAATAVLASLAEAMDRFEYDNAHGLDSAADDARKASLTAVTLAERIDDATIRGMVARFNQDLTRTPHGWRQRGGATSQQMDALRASHQDAVQAVGTVLRPLN
jgi:hypothetical protein